jgi:hypothetical protein
MNNPEHSAFKNDELIIKYKKECELFDFKLEEFVNNYEKESFLRCCPLCRK